MKVEERQRSREHQQYSMGIDRYRKQAEAREVGDQAAGRGLATVAARAMIPVVEEQVRLLESGDTLPSQVPLPYHYLLNLQADAVCVIAARICVSAGYVHSKTTRTALRIANLIEEHYRFEELRQSEPALASSMALKAKRWPTASARRKIMRKAAQIAGVAQFGWTEKEKAKLGMKLIEVFVETTGFAYLYQEKDGPRTIKMLRLSDEVLKRIEENHARLEGDEPVNVPMLCPPVPWTNPVSGGYLTEIMQQCLVRAVSVETRDDLLSADMPDVYDAVNAVQATPWRINRAVYDVLLECHRGNGQLGGLPSFEEEPLPPRPDIIDRKLSPEKMPEDMKAAFMEWKQAAREVYEHNAKLRSKRLALLTKLSIAGELKDEPQFYFPHSLDFRGRVYSMTAELSPQGDDIAKGLIEFAEGKPLGDSGAFWLHVHIANLFGVDKVSFDDRVLWVEQHSEQLIESALNPLDGQRFWTQADDPWCALAACFEYAGWRVQGDEFVSHLPIAMDGSCSGIQHFSAMLRDPEGGAAVNLTKRDAPADIYTEVLEVVKTKLKESSEPLAKVWLDKVDRKIVKRPCMTFAYSVTSVGIRDQIADEMRKQAEGDYLPGHRNWEAAKFLGPIVEEAIRTVVKRAAEAMDWLKDLSGFTSAENIPMFWTTPLGFPVVQPYRRAKGEQVNIWFAGERIRLSLRVESRDVDKKKHALSVAPNYVHSMDATHLMMVVNRLRDAGITRSFAMIHDSFGVHACDVDELHFAIRDEFIKLYSDDQLLRVYQSTLPALPGAQWENVPVPPEAGDLDLEEVRDADFFFA